MTRNRWWVALIGVCVALAVVCLSSIGQTAGQVPRPPEPVQSGRFQPFKTGFKGDLDLGECILDTATGKLWVLTRKDPQDKPKIRCSWELLADAPK
jgi:hypothetical protein